ncbi:hypothetical protein GRI89_01490 [Altererythrobacter salegens]|uniref:Lipoprotein n=1 Tax=Croceibacterium salegens TaxID=1737568 RepID=A0A6I4SRM1_9SPHN|nr:hypothetical protein [Croceibacterium salegens]MXO58219.1 hypothetical protein [Croceibacterium salegens]
MIHQKTFALAALLALASCGPEKSAEQPAASPSGQPTPATDVSSPEPQPTVEPVAVEGRDLILEQWAKAENKDKCAPVGFVPGEGSDGVPRVADFSGGWSVAFDLPGRRSAYGIAGTGLIPDDALDAETQRSRLQVQWPYFQDLGQLRQPAFAGYGMEGAAAYPEGNPGGHGVDSLAYVRIEGQECTYNVWSKLGRGHLERMLADLRMIEPG